MAPSAVKSVKKDIVTVQDCDSSLTTLSKSLRITTNHHKYEEIKDDINSWLDLRSVLVRKGGE